MKRRDLFKGVFAAPAMAMSPASSVEPPNAIIQGLQCSECRFTMVSDWDERVIFCSNRKCRNFQIKCEYYKVALKAKS
jgi:hypothetical protein